MMKSSSHVETEFGTLARQAWKHVIRERASALLAGMSPWIGLTLILALGLNWALDAGWGTGLLLLGAIGPWIAWGGIRMAQFWPTPLQAAQIWDDRCGRKGALSSALEFEEQGSQRVGEELHRQRALGELSGAEKDLKQAFPWPRPHASWLVLPVALLLLGHAGWKERLDELASRERREVQAQEAQKQAGTVREIADSLTKMAEEKAENEEKRELIEAVKETAARMEQTGGEGAQSVLTELEERARRLEEFAQEMDTGDSVWASEAFVRVMVEQIDLESLGKALQDRDARAGGREADAVAARLLVERSGSSLVERVGQGLRRVMDSANEEDQDRLVVQYTADAAEGMVEGQVERAAEAFAAMAGFFHGLVETRQRQDRLQQMADELRKAGMDIAQSGSQEGIGEVSQEAAGPAEVQPLTDHMPMIPVNQEERAAAESAGEARPGEELVPGRLAEAPTPQAGAEGETGDGNEPSLQAPVPGMAPESSPGVPGMTAPFPGGESPVAKLAGQLGGEQGTSSGVPGLEAGFGRAEMKPGEESSLVAQKESQVEARWNAEGESTLREVEPGEIRAESAQDAGEVAAEFLQVEESVMSEQTLPLARRGQVERYFRGIRREFEEE